MVKAMSVEELMSEVEGLSYKEQRSLCGHLHKCLNERTRKYRTEQCRRQGERYIKEMRKVVGGMDIINGGRDSAFVWGRNFIVWQLLQEGFSETQIGAAMGKDHSTISYIKGRVKDAMDFPSFYEKEMELWNKFKERI